MTDVAFHLNVGDRSVYACRLLRKAYLKGARLLVLADPGAIDGIDRALWLMGPGEFVPHARQGDLQSVVARSPILITDSDVGEFPAEVLVNLSAVLPQAPARFQRVIEIVGSGTEDKQMARERWKYYKSAGLEPQAHDLTETPGH
jgi:DNA polymerase-3 subunit chi